MFEGLIKLDVLNMVINTWCDSISPIAPWVAMSRLDLRDYLRKTLIELLEASTINLLYDMGQEEPVVGWCAYQVVDGLLVVHYIYIKYDYRGNRLGASLLQMMLPRGFKLGVDPIYTSFVGPFLVPHKSTQKHMKSVTQSRIDKYNIIVKPFFAYDLANGRARSDWMSD